MKAAVKLRLFLVRDNCYHSPECLTPIGQTQTFAMDIKDIFAHVKACFVLDNCAAEQAQIGRCSQKISTLHRAPVCGGLWPWITLEVKIKRKKLIVITVKEHKPSACVNPG